MTPPALAKPTVENPPLNQPVRLGGEGARLEDVQLVSTRDRAMTLENLLPAETWRKVSTDPNLQEFSGRIDREILLGVQAEREFIQKLQTELRGPQCQDLTQFKELQTVAHDSASRLSNRNREFLTAVGESPVALKEQLDAIRKAIYFENTEILKELGSALGKRQRELMPPQGAEPSTQKLQRRSAEQLFRGATKTVKLEENPLRDALEQCSLVVNGKVTRQMVDSLPKMVSQASKPALNDGQWQTFARSESAKSTVGLGFAGPSIFPAVTELSAAVATVVATRTHQIKKAGFDVDAGVASSPVGIVNIDFKGAVKEDGLKAKLLRAVGTEHVNMLMTILPSNEIENRDQQRSDSRKCAIGINAAISVDLAEKLHDACKGGRTMELVRDLMEYPPRGRAGEIIKWVRSGIVQPLLTTADQRPIEWIDSSPAQREMAFSHYVGSYQNSAIGPLSKGITDLCSQRE